jgi:glycosyltransferase involved in cell wall biosynthesis
MAVPKISVIMPVYNCEAYLPAALESILCQTCADFELLAIDDGSRDGSRSILEQYSQRDERLKAIFQEHAGLVASLNRGLAMAQGEYLARMDGDDVALPNRFSLQLEAMQSDPSLAIIGSAIQLIDERGAPLRLDRYPLHDTAIRWQLLFHCPFAHPAVMLRAAVLRRWNLRYDTQASQAEDYRLWSRLLSYARGANHPEPLLQRRLHAAQASERAGSDLQAAATQVSRSNLESLGISLSDAQVGALRLWYNRFPSELDGEGVALCVVLLDILRRFFRQPGLDFDVLRLIRGRWLLKILASRTAPGVGPFWKMRLLPRMRPGDLPAIAAYLNKRASGSEPGPVSGRRADAG